MLDGLPLLQPPDPGGMCWSQSLDNNSSNLIFLPIQVAQLWRSLHKAKQDGLAAKHTGTSKT